MARFIIVYNSTTGNTKAMADAIAEGARSLRVDADLVDAYDARIEDVAGADAVGFGVPTFHYHPAKPITKLLDDLRGKIMRGRIAVVFGSYGWSGHGPVVVAGRLREMGFRVLDPVIRVQYHPTENELSACVLLGKDVAMELKHIRKIEDLNAL